MKKNISTDHLFYYIPKTINNIKTTHSPIASNETIPIKLIKKHTFIGLKGSSTFDYLNKINQISPKYPNVFSNSFLTKNLRNKKSRNNIKRKNLLKSISINPANKLRLSKNCELFHVLNKTLMNDKNSLKDVNTKELLGINDIPRETNSENSDILEKTKFKNFYIKKSLSNDGRNNKNIKDLLLHKEFEQNNLMGNNDEHGLNKYYVNFIYNQIFPKFFFERHDKYNEVDNKLNIYYAENDAQFRENLIKANKILKSRGKPPKKLIINRRYVDDKLMEIKRKIGFVKGVSDYSIPSIILQKIKQNSKKLRLIKGKKKEFLFPFEEIKQELNRIDKLKTKVLSETMSISNIKNKI